MNIPSTQNFGIITLPLDAEVFPAEVVEAAQTVDALLIRWEEVRGTVSQSSIDQSVRIAEERDAQELSVKILRGDTKALDKTPHADKARADADQATIRAAATAKALNAAYVALREAMLTHIEEIRTRAAVAYRTAAEDLRKVVEDATQSYREAAGRFGGVAGTHYLVAALEAGARSSLSAPYVDVPPLDLSGTLAVIDREDKRMRASLDKHLPTYLGTVTGPNGIAMPVDLIRNFPPSDADGTFYNQVVLNDGTKVETVAQAREIVEQWKDYGLTVPSC